MGSKYAFIRIEEINAGTQRRLQDILVESGLVYSFSAFNTVPDDTEEAPWFPVTYEKYTDEYPLPVIGRGQLDAEDDIATINIEVYDPKWVNKLRAEGLTHLNLTDRTTD